MPGRDGRRAGAPRYPCGSPPSPGKHQRWQRVPWLGAGLVSVSALSGNSSASIRLLLQALGGTALARNASQHHPRSFLRVYRGRPATAGGLRTSRSGSPAEACATHTQQVLAGAMATDSESGLARLHFQLCRTPSPTWVYSHEVRMQPTSWHECSQILQGGMAVCCIVERRPPGSASSHQTPGSECGVLITDGGLPLDCCHWPANKGNWRRFMPT